MTGFTLGGKWFENQGFSSSRKTNSSVRPRGTRPLPPVELLRVRTAAEPHRLTRVEKRSQQHQCPDEQRIRGCRRPVSPVRQQQADPTDRSDECQQPTDRKREINKTVCHPRLTDCRPDSVRRFRGRHGLAAPVSRRSPVRRPPAGRPREAQSQSPFRRPRRPTSCGGRPQRR